MGPLATLSYHLEGLAPLTPVARVGFKFTQKANSLRLASGSICHRKLKNSILVGSVLVHPAKDLLLNGLIYKENNNMKVHMYFIMSNSPFTVLSSP